MTSTPTLFRRRADTTSPNPARKRRWWRELALALGLYWVYDLVHGAISGSAAHAYADGRDLLRWEQWVHLDPEHAMATSLVHLPALAIPACYFYASLHFIVTPAVLVWAYLRRPHDYRRARTALAVITFAALIGFWLFPAAPPRLLPGASIPDVLAHYRSWGWWTGDSSVPAPARAVANPFAAMPSLHVAWACWCGATVFTLVRRWWVRVVAVAYPVATALVVLATANHYLLDVLAGLALWLGVTWIVTRVVTRPPLTLAERS